MPPGGASRAGGGSESPGYEARAPEAISAPGSAPPGRPGAPGARPRRPPPAGAGGGRRAGERAPTSPLYRFTGAGGARGVVSGAARR